MSGPLINPAQKSAIANRRSGIPRTLLLGLLLILALEILLFSDVLTRPGPKVMKTDADVARVLERKSANAYFALARFVAINMTPLVWPAYLLFVDGLLCLPALNQNSTIKHRNSPIRLRPHHFALLCLASVSIWCLFDWINFYHIGRAWNYIGVPGDMSLLSRLDRYWGYLLAFAAIVPGMLLSGQVFLNLRLFDWARSPGWRMPRWAKWVALLAGAAMFLWPFLERNPIANLTLWTSLVFLLDPINQKLGRPSMFRDWQNGWYGRTLAAFAGGLTCGLLWEFWNYWALAKWTYHLDFLGPLEHYKYFEMPLPGLLGFLPFGLECWVMWQTVRVLLDGLAEPLPDDQTLL